MEQNKYLGIYIAAGKLLSARLDVTGVALADSIAFTSQAALLLIMFALHNKKQTQAEGPIPAKRPRNGELHETILRTLIGSAVAGVVAWVVLQRSAGYPSLIQGLASFLFGIVLVLPFIRKELKVFLKL